VGIGFRKCINITLKAYTRQEEDKILFAIRAALKPVPYPAKGNWHENCYSIDVRRQMKRRGFTTVELVVVLSIFAIIVLMTISLGPKMGQTSRLNRAVNQLVSDINLAKQMAATENRYMVFDFSDDGTYYTIRKQHDVSYFSTYIEDNYSWEVIKKASPLEGEDFFRADGVSDFAINSTGEVRLIDSVGPAHIDLTFFIKKSRWATPENENIAISKKVSLFPYGGIKIE